MSLAEAQRQYQIALEYRRTYSSQQGADRAVEEARRELETAWLETLAA